MRKDKISNLITITMEIKNSRRPLIDGIKPIVVVCLVIAALNQVLEVTSAKSSKGEDEALLNWTAPVEVQKKFPYYLSGFDSSNRPIWIAEQGKWDIRGTIEAGQHAVMDKYIDQFLLRMKDSVNMKSTANDPVNQFVLIDDLSDYTYYQLLHIPTITFLTRAMFRVEASWRTALHRGFLINANPAFETFFAIVKPVLGKLGEKMSVYGTNSAKWKPVLLKSLPKGQIPYFYGGTLNVTGVIKVYG